jgi:hypothetical protein
VPSPSKPRIHMRHAKQQLTTKLRAQVLQRDDNTCKICGVQLEHVQLEIAHIQPLPQGGARTADNLMIVCPNCHAQYARRYVAQSIQQTPNHHASFVASVGTIAPLNIAVTQDAQLQIALRNLLFANVIFTLARRGACVSGRSQGARDMDGAV